MIKIILTSLLCLFISNASFAAKAVDWSTVSASNKPIYLPNTGIFKEVGSSTLLFTSPATSATYEVVFYQSNGTTIVSREGLMVIDSVSLISPYFNIRAVGSSVMRMTAEAYIK